MKATTLRFITLSLGILFIGFTACKNNKQDEQANSIPDKSALKKDTIKLELKANDKMEYNKDKLYVGEGQTVVLTLKHTGNMSKETMGHDFILLDHGASGSRFAKKANKATDNHYIPKNETDHIIAHTPLIGGGESARISFEAPDRGSYEFLCSFPGHYPSMHGKFIVK